MNLKNVLLLLINNKYISQKKHSCSSTATMTGYKDGEYTKTTSSESCNKTLHICPTCNSMYAIVIPKCPKCPPGDVVCDHIKCSDCFLKDITSKEVADVFKACKAMTNNNNS